MKKLFLATFILAAMLAPRLASADLTYDGAVSIAENVMTDAAKAFEAKTKIKIKIEAHGGDDAYAAVMSGKADIGGIPRPLTGQEKKEMKSIVIAYDAVTIFVNQQNPVYNLSKAQAKEIFTGKITNWKQVGGKDALIRVVVTGMKTRSLFKEFQRIIMDNEAYAGVTEFAPGVHDHVAIVAKDPNAITFDTFTYIRTGFKIIALNGIVPTKETITSEAYLFSRPINLISKKTEQPEVKSFFEFMLSDEGQLIARKNFITK